MPREAIEHEEQRLAMMVYPADALKIRTRSAVGYVGRLGQLASLKSR